MDKNSVRIVFMGTPEFAVESLRALVEGGYNVVGVVTMPDKPIGRHGSVLQASPVKQYAVEHGLTVLQPQKLKDEAFVESLRALNAQLQIVVAFRMLPEVVWAMPTLGTFNLHASLLPQYRGAAPINWAIINGEKETGITTFFLKHEIDTGEVIQQVKIPILDTDNVGDVHDRLMALGAELVTQTVDAIIDGTVRTIPQELIAGKNASLKPAPKIFHDTCRIDWKHMNTKQVYDFIRGLSPYPAAWTTLVAGDKVTEMKVFETRKLTLDNNDSDQVGTIKTDGRTYLRVRLVDGLIDILTLQLAGKKRMDVAAFLNGFKVEEGMRME
ncbi:MAG: methionyl-tRNA formyltransferase [Bacteroidaceae bacterium]|nr:methionyl-tRNA formyltransferase [Bacteroidaceae bacterium]